MAKERKHRMTESTKAFMMEFLKENNITSAKDLQEGLKELFGSTIQEMLEAEMDNHLGYSKNEYTDEKKVNYRNGYSDKTVRSTYGEVELEIPRDRTGEFTPQIVPKYGRDISEIEDKIISMYARGQGVRDISATIQDIYGFEVSAQLVSDITDKVLPEIQEWQKRGLDEVMPVVFIDAIHFNVRQNGVITKKAVYVVLGINKDGFKDVLGLYVGENESSKYWLTVLNELKNRGLKDILILCADGLAGLKEAVDASYPKADLQRCIVHQIRNTMKHVNYKDMKVLANDLKDVYTAPTADQGYKALEEVAEKWKKYKTSFDSWFNNWDVISPFFKYNQELRTVMYTTNAIESLNSSYRRLNKNRVIFPTDQALMKGVYLATTIIVQKWTQKIRNWGEILCNLQVFFEGRI